MELGAAAPEPPAGQIEHQTAAEPGDVGLPVGDGGDLAAEALRSVPVVVVPVGHDLAAGQVAGLVAHGPDAPGGLAGDHVAEAGVVGEQPGQTALAVFDDHQFGADIVLGEEIPHRLAGELGPAPGRHDGRDQGHRRPGGGGADDPDRWRGGGRWRRRGGGGGGGAGQGPVQREQGGGGEVLGTPPPGSAPRRGWPRPGGGVRRSGPGRGGGPRSIPFASLSRRRAEGAVPVGVGASTHTPSSPARAARTL